MVTRKKNGAPDSKHFEAPETVAKFEPVKQWLLKNCRKVSSSTFLGGARGREKKTLAHRAAGIKIARAVIPYNAHLPLPLPLSLHTVHAGGPTQQQEPGHAGVRHATVPGGRRLMSRLNQDV